MPGSTRLFVPAPLRPGAEIAPSPAQAHHLGAVLRLKPGARIAVFNGADGEWQARIAMLARGEGRLAVEEQRRPQEPEPDLWLAFALLKRDATDLVAEKATELGVSALFPVLTARTQASQVNLARLAAIAQGAAEQSERLSLPAIHPPRTLARLLAEWPPERRLVAAVERAGAPPIAAGTGGAPAGLLVGPEGGFTPAELDVLARHPFVTLAGLGPRILRAETAAIVGLALLSALASTA